MQEQNSLKPWKKPVIKLIISFSSARVLFSPLPKFDSYAFFDTGFRINCSKHDPETFTSRYRDFASVCHRFTAHPSFLQVFDRWFHTAIRRIISTIYVKFVKLPSFCKSNSCFYFLSGKLCIAETCFRRRFKSGTRNSSCADLY